MQLSFLCLACNHPINKRRRKSQKDVKTQESLLEADKRKVLEGTSGVRTNKHKRMKGESWGKREMEKRKTALDQSTVVENQP